MAELFSTSSCFLARFWSGNLPRVFWRDHIPRSAFSVWRIGAVNSRRNVILSPRGVILMSQFDRMIPGLQSDTRTPLSATDRRPGHIGRVVEYPKPASTDTVSSASKAGNDGFKGISEEILTNAILSADGLADIAIPQRENICGTWLKQGDLGFVFAERGLGKTWLALYLARSLAEGKNVGPWPVNKSRRVLLVDGEMPLDGIRERNTSLRSGKGDLYVLNHEWLFQKSGCVLNLSHTNTQVALFRLCIAQQFELIVLDNLSCLFSGLVENDADSWEQVLPWLLDLRRHKIAVIVIHHANRSGQNMRGTSKREDAAFWVLRLDGVSDHSRDSEGARFVSRFTKARQGSRDELEPLEWNFQPTGESTHVTYRRLPTSDVFKQWIRDGLTSCTDIAEEMGISRGQVSKLAKRGEREGWLRIEGRSYKLVEAS